MAGFTVEIDTRQIAEIARRMDLLPAFKDGIEASAIYVKGVVAEYPPDSDANRAGLYPKHWYVRGTGPHWALKGGGYHFSRTSETLGKKWAIKTTHQGMGAVIGNNVSYGPYVQARDKQAQFHKNRNWKTVEDVVEDETRNILEKISMFVVKAMKR